MRPFNYSEIKNQKWDSEQGVNMGITTEQRSGQRGVYTVVVYNREAQGFIIDNLDAILALKYSK